MGMDLFDGDDPRPGIFALMQGKRLQYAAEGEEDEAGREEYAEVKVKLTSNLHGLLDSVVR